MYGVVVVVNSSGPASWLALELLTIRLPRAPDAHVVAVLMARVLPASLADDPQQDHLARVHVRIAVVRLVRIWAA